MQNKTHENEEQSHSGLRYSRWDDVTCRIPSPASALGGLGHRQTYGPARSLPPLPELLVSPVHTDLQHRFAAATRAVDWLFFARRSCGILPAEGAPRWIHLPLHPSPGAVLLRCGTRGCPSVTPLPHRQRRPVTASQQLREVWWEQLPPRERSPRWWWRRTPGCRCRRLRAEAGAGPGQWRHPGTV